MRSLARRSIHSLGSVLVGLVLVACGVDASTDTSEDDYRTRPEANGEGAASFVVFAPPAGDKVILTEYALNVDPRRLRSTELGTKPLGMPFEGVLGSAGEYRFFAMQPGVQMEGTYPIELRPAKRTEVRFGGLELRKIDVRSTFGVEILASHRNNTVVDITRMRLWIKPGELAEGGIVPVPAGDHVFTWGFGDGMRVHVAEGQVANINLADYSQRTAARIVPPKRELPSACPEQRPELYGAGDVTEPIALNEPLVVGQWPALEYGFEPRIHLPCMAYGYKIPLGAVGAGPVDYQLGRIDVDDVMVTSPDGSKTAVRGTYTVLDSQGRSVLLPSSPKKPTNTGLDLPPGTYKVIIEYPTAAGGKGRIENTFTTP